MTQSISYVFHMFLNDVMISYILFCIKLSHTLNLLHFDEDNA